MSTEREYAEKLGKPLQEKLHASAEAGIYDTEAAAALERLDRNFYNRDDRMASEVVAKTNAEYMKSGTTFPADKKVEELSRTLIKQAFQGFLFKEGDVSSILTEGGEPLMKKYGVAALQTALQPSSNSVLVERELHKAGVVSVMDSDSAAKCLELASAKSFLAIELAVDIIKSKKVDLSGEFGERVAKAFAANGIYISSVLDAMQKEGLDFGGKFGQELAIGAVKADRAENIVDLIKSGAIRVDEAFGRQLFSAAFNPSPDANAQSQAVVHLVSAGVPDPDGIAEKTLRRYVENAYWSHPVENFLKAGLKVDNALGAELREINQAGRPSENRQKIEELLTQYGAPKNAIDTTLQSGSTEVASLARASSLKK